MDGLAQLRGLAAECVDAPTWSLTDGALVDALDAVHQIEQVLAAVKLHLVREVVALTIDTEVHPPKILLIRGRAELDVVDGIPDEYLQMNGSYQMTPERIGGSGLAIRARSLTVEYWRAGPRGFGVSWRRRHAWCVRWRRAAEC